MSHLYGLRCCRTLTVRKQHTFKARYDSKELGRVEDVTDRDDTQMAWRLGAAAMLPSNHSRVAAKQQARDCGAGCRRKIDGDEGWDYDEMGWGGVEVLREGFFKGLK